MSEDKKSRLKKKKNANLVNIFFFQDDFEKKKGETQKLVKRKTKLIFALQKSC